MTRWCTRPGTLLGLCLAVLAFGPAGAAAAHPLGNFTVNHYDGLRLYADRSRLVEREAGLRARFAAAHPEVPTTVVPALAGDVHDLVDLRRVGVLLGGQDGDTLVETG